jgi:hypothetical protein
MPPSNSDQIPPRRCSYAAGCSEPAAAGLNFCQAHADELHHALQMVTPRCERCGLLVPEGLLRHDCAKPASQPPDAELI